MTPGVQTECCRQGDAGAPNAHRSPRFAVNNGNSSLSASSRRIILHRPAGARGGANAKIKLDYKPGEERDESEILCVYALSSVR
jgi:hypothetical protein